MLLASCSRTPEACISSPKTIVDLGESITFVNCTEKTALYEVDFGDGNSADSDDSDALTHIFESPGTFTVTLEAEHEQSGNQDEFTMTISVNEPDAEELKGTWNLYKSEDYLDFGFFGEDVETTSRNEDYSIDSDSIVLSVDGRASATYEYDLFKDAELRLSDSGSGFLYRIVRLTDGEMVWQDGDSGSGSYERLYFIKR